MRYYMIISYSAAVSLREQLEHIARRRLESHGYLYDESARKFYAPSASILGVPSMPSHLPQAEAILPGHTLIRPTLGMLKSSVKFPHRELEGGAGVYGNIDHLGIKYDGVNERLLYTGFRRTPEKYILILPQKNKQNGKPLIFLGAPITVDSDLFSTDPNDDDAIMQNRVETNRAIKEFFAKGNFVRDEKEKGREQKNDNHALNYSLRLGVDNYEKSSEEKNMIVSDDNENHSVEDKKTWFAKSKNAYNHLKISASAPEISEFLPATDEIEVLRNWWFYNQDDFQPFQNTEKKRRMKSRRF